MIHTVAYNSRLDATFCITFIYASNNGNKRLVLWEDLKGLSIGRKHGSPSVISIMFCTRMKGLGEPLHWRQTEPFVECVAKNGLTDLKARGCYYTWVRRGESGDGKCSKIDRALVNIEWLIWY